MGTDTFDLAKSLEITASEGPPLEDAGSVDLTVAENILLELAAAFPLADSLRGRTNTKFVEKVEAVVALPEVDARYRTLVEQIPAVVFMAFLDKGIGEAYVSPQIEAILGFSQEEWLNDPVRWYQQIHPADKGRLEY